MNESDVARFWSHVDRLTPDECWPWTAARGRTGYGRFSVGGRKGTMRTASRVAYEIQNGPAGDKHVRHICDNPPCCNPAHLILGDHADNMRDMAARERGWKTRLTASDVARIRIALGDGAQPKRLAEEYGVVPSTIGMIARFETWKHVTLDTFALLLEGGPDNLRGV